MSDIEWQNGAVCYGDGRQWFVNTGSESDKFELVNNDGTRKYSLYGALNYPKDFQLNEIRTGDFIPASELDTEQKYNEVVEVFGLFGFRVPRNKNYFSIKDCEVFKTFCDYVVPDVLLTADCKRQLTYHQIIAIGKLKRMMLEREKPALIDDNSVQAKLSNIGNVLHNLSCLENDEDLQGDLYNYASYLWDLSKSIVNEKSTPKATANLTADKPKSAVDYLNECVEVQKQRGDQYDSTGTGERSFSACADAYNAITGGNLKGSDICLILQILKDVRQYSNPSRLHEDSVLDKVSYSSLHAEELNKELK